LIKTRKTDKDTTPMNEPNLLLMCLSAFAAVLVLLSMLALTMRLLIAVFRPPSDAATAARTRSGDLDPAFAAAIAAAAHTVLPGGRIIGIEEIKDNRPEDS
jgi:hypothetical protein